MTKDDYFRRAILVASLLCCWWHPAFAVAALAAMVWIISTAYLGTNKEMAHLLENQERIESIFNKNTLVLKGEVKELKDELAKHKWSGAMRVKGGG